MEQELITVLQGIKSELVCIGLWLLLILIFKR